MVYKTEVYVYLQLKSVNELNSNKHSIAAEDILEDDFELLTLSQHLSVPIFPVRFALHNL